MVGRVAQGSKEMKLRLEADHSPFLIQESVLRVFVLTA